MLSTGRSAQEDARIAAHEAGHSTACYLLRGRVGPVSIRPSRRWAGIAHAGARRAPAADMRAANFAVPYVMLPSKVRAQLEHDALISLCGPLAGRVYGPDWARRCQPEFCETLVAPASELIGEEREWLRRGDDSNAPSIPDDEERAHRAMFALGGSRDADRLLRLMRSVAEQLVLATEFRRGVDALVPALLKHVDIGAQDARAVLRDAFGRDARRLNGPLREAAEA